MQNKKGKEFETAVTVLRTGLEDTTRCLEEAIAREKEVSIENKKAKESYYRIQLRAQATERGNAERLKQMEELEKEVLSHEDALEFQELDAVEKRKGLDRVYEGVIAKKQTEHGRETKEGGGRRKAKG